MNQLVALEQFLNRLVEDVEHAQYRRNELVAHAISDASASLTHGFKCLANERLSKAHLHVKNAWLQSSYARQLFDAETVEFELGEGNYLELLDVTGEFLPAATSHFTYLENDLKRIRSEIQERSRKAK